LPNCYFCDEPIWSKRVEVLGAFDRREGWAHDACSDDANERADERRIEDFYGSSSPQTAREREEQERKDAL
jgi:hypothetical protein